MHKVLKNPATAILIFFLIRSIFSCSEAPRKFPARANAEGMTQWDPFEHSLSQEAGPKKNSTEILLTWEKHVTFHPHILTLFLIYTWQ